MANDFYKTGKYYVDHSTFGGLIYLSDFNTEHKGTITKRSSTLATRILSDWSFDKQCARDKELSSKQY